MRQGFSSVQMGVRLAAEWDTSVSSLVRQFLIHPAARVSEGDRLRWKEVALRARVASLATIGCAGNRSALVTHNGHGPRGSRIGMPRGISPRTRGGGSSIRCCRVVAFKEAEAARSAIARNTELPGAGIDI